MRCRTSSTHLGKAVAEAGGEMVEGLATDEEYPLFAYGADAETLLATLLAALEREGLTRGGYAVVRRGGWGDPSYTCRTSSPPAI